MKRLKLNPFASSKEDIIERHYISPNWQQNIELISHLCQFSQSMLFIIAPEGGGKTTFAHYFLQSAIPFFSKTMLSVNKQTNMKDLFLKAVESKPSLDGSAIHVVMIDDAHLLTKEQIHSLIYYVNHDIENDQNLRFILLGEPALELRYLAMDLVEQNPIYTIELEAWTKQDIYQYLVKDCQLNVNFDTIEGIFEKTNGNPKQIMEEKLKKEKSLKSRKKMSRNNNFKKYSIHPMMISALGGVLLGGAYLFYNNSLEEDKLGMPLNLAQHTEQGWIKAELSPSKPEPAIQFHFEGNVAQSDEDMMADVGPRKMPLATNVPTIEIVGEQKLPAENITQQVASTDVSEKWITKSEAIFPLTEEEKHLLEVEKNHYTLQLLGTGKEESVKQFIQSYALKDKTYRFKTKRGGKDWFVVVYGEYPSVVDAKAAVRTMPEKLRQAKVQPWVREIQDIQNDIRKQG